MRAGDDVLPALRRADPGGACPDGTFTEVVTGDTVSHGKPHPEPYLTAAKLLGVHPEDCLAIEDSDPGTTSAVAAGCTGAGHPEPRAGQHRRAAGSTATRWPASTSLRSDGWDRSPSAVQELPVHDTRVDPMPLPIEDYALVGDRRTAALVGRNGSVDWLCLPRFDSSACFAALLGDESNGHWQLEPEGEYDVTRTYLGDTALLETTFTTDRRAGHAARRDAHQRPSGRPGAPGDRRPRHGADAPRVGRPLRLRQGPPVGVPGARQG